MERSIHLRPTRAHASLSTLSTARLGRELQRLSVDALDAAVSGAESGVGLEKQRTALVKFLRGVAREQENNSLLLIGDESRGKTSLLLSALRDVAGGTAAPHSSAGSGSSHDSAATAPMPFLLVYLDGALIDDDAHALRELSRQLALDIDKHTLGRLLARDKHEGKPGLEHGEMHDEEEAEFTTPSSVAAYADKQQAGPVTPSRAPAPPPVGLASIAELFRRSQIATAAVKAELNIGSKPAHIRVARLKTAKTGAGAAFTAIETDVMGSSNGASGGGHTAKWLRMAAHRWPGLVNAIRADVASRAGTSGPACDEAVACAVRTALTLLPDADSVIVGDGGEGEGEEDEGGDGPSMFGAGPGSVMSHGTGAGTGRACDSSSVKGKGKVIGQAYAYAPPSLLPAAMGALLTLSTGVHAHACAGPTQALRERLQGAVDVALQAGADSIGGRAALGAAVAAAQAFFTNAGAGETALSSSGGDKGSGNDTSRASTRLQRAGQDEGYTTWGMAGGSKAGSSLGKGTRARPVISRVQGQEEGASGSAITCAPSLHAGEGAGMGPGSYEAHLDYFLRTLQDGTLGNSEGGEGRGSGRPLFIVIDRFDVFAARSRQTLLYSLLDLTQSPRVHLAVIGMTSNCECVDMLEKRLKSRFSSQAIHVGCIQRPSDSSVIARRALSLSCQPSSRSTLWDSAVDALLDDPDVRALLFAAWKAGKVAPWYIAWMHCAVPVVQGEGESPPLPSPSSLLALPVLHAMCGDLLPLLDAHTRARLMARAKADSKEDGGEEGGQGGLESAGVGVKRAAPSPSPTILSHTLTNSLSTLGLVELSLLCCTASLHKRDEGVGGKGASLITFSRTYGLLKHRAKALSSGYGMAKGSAGLAAHGSDIAHALALDASPSHAHATSALAPLMWEESTAYAAWERLLRADLLRFVHPLGADMTGGGGGGGKRRKLPLSYAEVSGIPSSSSRSSAQETAARRQGLAWADVSLTFAPDDLCAALSLPCGTDRPLILGAVGGDTAKWLLETAAGQA